MQTRLKHFSKQHLEIFMDPFSCFVKPCSRCPSASSGPTGRLCKTLLSMASLNAAKSDLWSVDVDGAMVGNEVVNFTTASTLHWGRYKKNSMASAGVALHVVKCAWGVRTHKTCIIRRYGVDMFESTLSERRFAEKKHFIARRPYFLNEVPKHRWH